MIGSSTLGEPTSSVARNTSTIGSPSQLPTTPPVRIAAAIAIHASPSDITSIRTGTNTSVMRLVSNKVLHAEWVASGFRCPLTSLAERLGAPRGSVTDIYLPSDPTAKAVRAYDREPR